MDPNTTPGQPTPNQPWTPQSGGTPPTNPMPPSMPPAGASPVVPGMSQQNAPAGMSPQPGMPGAAPDMPSMMSAGSDQQRRNSNMALIVVAVVVVFLLIAGVITYFAFIKKDSNAANKAANSSTNSASKAAVPLSTLNNMEFVAPTAAQLAGYQADSGGTGFHTYLTSGSVSTKYCALSFGTQSSTQLPGSDVNGIVNPQIASLKKLGATVVGPTAGAARVLKDSTDSSKSYSVPTLNFDLSADNKHETDHYSVSILGNGTRALVVTSCVNANGAIDAAGLAQVDETAKLITVKQL